MKTKMMSMVIVSAVVILLNGCGSGKQTKTGFLSDYSKLQKDSGSSLRYVNETSARTYSAFIVEPVEVYFHDGAKSKGKLTAQQLADLTNYAHTKTVEAVRNAGYTVTNQPGAGVAKIRIALTDIEKSSAVSIIPQASLMGAGIGGASMEAEIVDSVTKDQIGAVIQSGKGSRIPFTNLGDWTAAKSVIDEWTQNFQKKLESMRK